MRLFALAPLAFLVACASTDVPAASPDDLRGHWDVALHYDPDKAPSSTKLVVTGQEDGELEGNFYGAEFQEARVNTHLGEVLFTAITGDNSGLYIHSGRLRGEVIEGQTLSLGRDFLMPWTATREGADGE